MSKTWRDEVHQGEKQLTKAWRAFDRGAYADTIEPIAWASLHAGRADVLVEPVYR